PTRLQHTIALGHRLPHHGCPVSLGLLPNVVDDDLFLVPMSVETKPGFPDIVKFPILDGMTVWWVGENVVDGVARDLVKIASALTGNHDFGRGKKQAVEARDDLFLYLVVEAIGDYHVPRKLGHVVTTTSSTTAFLPFPVHSTAT